MYLKLHILPLDFLIKPVAQVLRPHFRQSRYLPGVLPCDIRSEAAIRRSHPSENSSIAAKVLNRVVPRCSSWLEGQLNTTRSLPGPKGTRYPTMAQNNCDRNHEKRWQSSGDQGILKGGTNGKTEKRNCPEGNTGWLDFRHQGQRYQERLGRGVGDLVIVLLVRPV